MVENGGFFHQLLLATMLTSSTTTSEVHILNDIVTMKLIFIFFFHKKDYKSALSHCQAFKHSCQTIVHDTYFHDFNFLLHNVMIHEASRIIVLRTCCAYENARGVQESKHSITMSFAMMHKNGEDPKEDDGS